MSYVNLNYEVSSAVATVTVAREKALNALTVPSPAERAARGVLGCGRRPSRARHHRY